MSAPPSGRLLAIAADRNSPRLTRGVFHSLVSLQEAINRYVAEANTDPRPFRWIKHPDKIIAALRRRHQALDSLH